MTEKITQKRTPVLPKVLTFLARKTEANRWQIKKQLRVSYSNVYNAIEGLLKDKLIRISKTKRSAKNPKIDVDYYQLTFIGLLTGISRKGIWKYIDEVANAQKINFRSSLANGLSLKGKELETKLSNV